MGLEGALCSALALGEVHGLEGLEGGLFAGLGEPSPEGADCCLDLHHPELLVSHALQPIILTLQLD